MSVVSLQEGVLCFLTGKALHGGCCIGGCSTPKRDRDGGRQAEGQSNGWCSGGLEVLGPFVTGGWES